MPQISEEELEKLRSDNEKLRNKTAEARSKQSENEAQRLREFEATQLLTENRRLQAEYNNANAFSKVGASREGVSGLMENAQNELEKAAAAAEADPGPVDTNAENQPQGTTAETVTEPHGEAEKNDGGN